MIPSFIEIEILAEPAIYGTLGSKGLKIRMNIANCVPPIFSR